VWEGFGEGRVEGEILTPNIKYVPPRLHTIEVDLGPIFDATAVKNAQVIKVVTSGECN